MFDQEPAIAAMIVPQDPRAPMLGRRQRDAPAAVRETLPPLQFDDALEAKVRRQIAHAPRHDARFSAKAAGAGSGGENDRSGRVSTRPNRSAANPGFSSRRAGCVLITNSQLAKLGSINMFKSVNCARKRGVADPRQRHLTVRQLGKSGPDVLSDAPASAAPSTPSRKKKCAD